MIFNGVKALISWDEAICFLDLKGDGPRQSILTLVWERQTDKRLKTFID